MPQKRYPQGMLGACDVPWTEDYQVDEPVFRRHVQHLLDSGFDEMYILGTAGEGYALNDAQYRNLVDLFLDATGRPGFKPMVGVISLSTSQIIERIGYAHEKGVRRFQMPLPSWGAVNDAELLNFFKTVCGEFPNAMFFHYNLIRAKRVLTGRDYHRLTAEVPNLVGTKNSSQDMVFIRGLMLDAPELQHFMLEHTYSYAALFGECSLLSSLASIFPNLSRDQYEAGRDGDLDRLFAIHRRVLDVHQGLFGHVSSAHMDGAYHKMMMHVVDPEFSRRMLPPYTPMSDEEFAQAKRYYDEHCGDIS